MKEPIDLADICISPHRAAYEEFLQLDRREKDQPFDPTVGLYGLISSVFPFHDVRRESIDRHVPVYPKKRGIKAKPTAEEVEDEVRKWFPDGMHFYAYEDVTLPISKELIVSSGALITKEAVARIAEYNVSQLGDPNGKPIRRIKILYPEQDEENQIGSWIQRGGFDPRRLERVQRIRVELTGYDLQLPFDGDTLAKPDNYLKDLDERARECQKRGETLRAGVRLTFQITVEKALVYEGVSYDLGQKTVKRHALFGYFPLFTERDTFIINGLERTPVAQLLPRPGIYLLRESENDDIASEILPKVRIRPERGHFLTLTPVSGENGAKSLGIQVTVGKVGKHECDLISFLEDMGIIDKVRDLVTLHGGTWPNPLDEETPLTPYLKSLFHSQLFEGKAGYRLGRSARESLQECLASIYSTLEVDAEALPKDHLMPEDLAAAILFLQESIKNPDMPGDDLLDLRSQHVRLLTDHLKETIESMLPTIEKRLRFQIRTAPDPAKAPLNFSEPVSKALNHLFQGELCQIHEDTNPLAEISHKRKITLRGPGGIKTKYGNFKRRGIHPSQYGRICITETPESENIGFPLHLALAAKIEDGKLKAPYLPIRDQSVTLWLSPEEEAKHVITPQGHGQYSEPDGRLLVRKTTNGQQEVAFANSSEGTLQDKYSGQFLGLSANLVPLIQHNDNNRVMMGAKNMKQAIPLLFPEAPLIKTGREELAARISGKGLYAIKGGVVNRVLEDRIEIKDSNGEMAIYALRPIRPTFDHTISWHRPLVSRGQKIEQGQVLADGACMRLGELALGVNLLVAYMPYYGLNFEDGIVISDRLVKDDVLTSLHLRELAFEVYGDERMGSEETSQEMLVFHLWKGVMCREGQEIGRGDPLFGKYRREGQKVHKDWLHSPVNGTFIDYDRVWVNPTTIKPSKVRYRMVCHILEEHKIEVGDKLMGRHGNKGVVSRIIPEEKMPHLEDGTPVDIILNPHGVVSRMNLGQILETHLGWIIKRGGDKYKDIAVIAPFERIQEETIRRALRSLEDTGINEEGKAILIDGRSGLRIENPVTVGYQYFMKLNHLVEDKINVRETGNYTLISRQPIKGRRWQGGQRIGEMEVWALEAHLAQHLLQEFMTVKADALALRRRELVQAYFGKDSPLEDQLPFTETLRATTMLLRGLCLHMRLHGENGEEIPLISPDLGTLEAVTIRLADEKAILDWAENRLVKSSELPRIKRGVLDNPKDGLFHGSLFPDPRFSMACIKLVEPVIHPLYVSHFKSEIREKGGVGKGIEVRELLRAIDFVNALCLTSRGNEVSIISSHDLVKITLHTQRLLAGALLVREVLGDELEAPLSHALLTCIPVLPKNYRPLRAQHGKIEISSDLNGCYREILIANSTLERALKAGVPQRRLFFLRARLQRAVNRLLVGDKDTATKNQNSIGDRIKGKEGILRMYLLGKRVDVSARSVIVPQPELNLDEVGIPLEMAVGLTQSKLIGILAEKCEAETQKGKRLAAERILAEIEESMHRKMVEELLFGRQAGLLKDAVVLLNRAPSLHRYNMLAFRPVCVHHRAIGLHPLTCSFYNADFDGDQMGVFLPLLKEAQDEAKIRLNPIENMFSTANGKPMLHLSQDIVLGIYVLTSTDAGTNLFNQWFAEAGLDPVTEPVIKSALVDRLHKYHIAVNDPVKTASLTQKIMEVGFRTATLSGLTFSIFDVPYLTLEEREDIIKGINEEDWRETVDDVLEKRFGLGDPKEMNP